jgi:hypothetical protein
VLSPICHVVESGDFFALVDCSRIGLITRSVVAVEVFLSLLHSTLRLGRYKEERELFLLPLLTLYRPCDNVSPPVCSVGSQVFKCLTTTSLDFLNEVSVTKERVSDFSPPCSCDNWLLLWQTESEARHDGVEHPAASNGGVDSITPFPVVSIVAGILQSLKACLGFTCCGAERGRPANGLKDLLLKLRSNQGDRGDVYWRGAG